MRVNQTRELLEMRIRQEYEQAVTVLIDEKTSNQKKNRPSVADQNIRELKTQTMFDSLLIKTFF